MKYIDISNVEMCSFLPKIDFNPDNGAYELAISLFERCNMNCKFCFQSHESSIDFNYITDIPRILKKKLTEEMLKYNVSDINVKIWGGEPFLNLKSTSDNMKLFTSYKMLMKGLRSTFNFIRNHTGLQFTEHYRWLTNGIFDYNIIEHVISLVRETDISIGMSFDPERFHSDKLFYRWLSNYSMLHDITDVALSITLSKGNINEYLTSGSLAVKTFKDILKNPKMAPSSVDISYYTASSNWKEDLPSEEDLFLFFRWCIDHNFRVIKVIDDIYRSYNGEEVIPYCDCTKAATFTKGKLVKNCALRSSLPQEMFYGEYVECVNEQNCGEYKNSLGLVKQGCLTCKYSYNCQKLCWLSVIFEHYKTGRCPFKRAYKYLEWRNEL